MTRVYWVLAILFVAISAGAAAWLSPQLAGPDSDALEHPR